jgi:hypothetical protein
MIYDSRLRDEATGELVTYEEVFAEFPPEELDPVTGTPPGMTQLYPAGPLSGPLWILSHASHVSLLGTGCTRLRRLRRFTGNPVCGTKFAILGPI